MCVCVSTGGNRRSQDQQKGAQGKEVRVMSNRGGRQGGEERGGMVTSKRTKTFMGPRTGPRGGERRN